MGQAGMQLPDDDPRVGAWTAYKETEDYENTKRAAMEPLHVDGSLWAAFLAGIEANRIMPIQLEELARRGVDAELEARSIDVVLRCGWPRRDRSGDVHVVECIPVPTTTLTCIRDFARGIGNSAAAQSIRDTCNQLLAEHEVVQGLYVKALPDCEPLPEPG
jgi:hypothetical protein